VAEYGERDLVRGQGICECQQDVYRDDDKDASLSDGLGDFGVLFDQFGKPE
jgi:hypothetical protein